MTRARGDTPGPRRSNGGPPPAQAETPPRGQGEASRNRRRNGGGRHGHVYAALDLGTNNCRLLIARPEGRSFRVLDAFSRVVRLGEGVEASNSLSQQAMDRSVAALGVCAEKMRRRGVTRARAIATEACRRAANGGAFVKRVREETGIELDVIHAGEEARLAVAGCAPLFDPRRNCLLVFDIGGGSTEIVWIDLAETPRERRRDILMGVAPKSTDSEMIAREVRALADKARWVSLPVGVVTLAERFKHIENEQERFGVMRAHTESLIAPFAGNGAGATPERLKRMQLLGTSGTITTLAGVHLGLPRYTRSEVDGLWMRSDDLNHVITDLLGMNRDQRALSPCVGDDRADLIISGSAILRAITGFWPTEKLRVADRGLREGLLYGLMNREDALARLPKRRAAP